MSTSKWELLGSGAFNSAYRSENGKGSEVLKIPHGIAKDTDDPERATRVWKTLNEDMPLPPARIAVTEFGYGWICPFIEGSQASDEEMEGALIDIYNRTGRIVVDATASNNFLTTSDGRVVCVDIGLALQLEKESDRHLARKVRRQSGVSIDMWREIESEYKSSFFKESALLFPKTVKVIKALLFIKNNRPDIYDVNFLKDNKTLVDTLAKGYDRQNMAAVALEELKVKHEEAQKKVEEKQMTREKYESLSPADKKKLLDSAVRFSHFEDLKDLLEIDTNNGETLLSIAVKHEDVKVVEYLLEYLATNASEEAFVKACKKSLLDTVERDDVEIVKYLMDSLAKKSPNQFNEICEETFLVATAKGHSEVVRCLMDYLINQQNDPGLESVQKFLQKALVVAVQEGHAKVVEGMLDYLEQKKKGNLVSFRNVLQEALGAALKEGHVKVVEGMVNYLVQKKKGNLESFWELESVRKFLQGTLVVAAEEGRDARVEYLKDYLDDLVWKKKLEPEFAWKVLQEALGAAVRKDHVKVVEYLKNNLKEALVSAAERGQVDTVKYLMDYMGDLIQEKNLDSKFALNVLQTALVAAVEDSNVKVVQVLVEYVNREDNTEILNAALSAVLVEVGVAKEKEDVNEEEDVEEEEDVDEEEEEELEKEDLEIVKCLADKKFLDMLNYIAKSGIWNKQKGEKGLFSVWQPSDIENYNKIFMAETTNKKIARLDELCQNREQNMQKETHSSDLSASDLLRVNELNLIVDQYVKNRKEGQVIKNVKEVLPLLLKLFNAVKDQKEKIVTSDDKLQYSSGPNH